MIKLSVVEYECLQTKSRKWKKLHSKVATRYLTKLLTNLAANESIRNIRVVQS